MNEFLAMGGYAFYVWMSYGLAASVTIAMVALPVLKERRLLREIARRAHREGA